jgi:hypothetical protein
MGNISRAFYRDYTRAKAEKQAANNKFAVVSLKKDGMPRKVMLEDIRNGFTEMDAAMLKADKMKELNPGKTFVVIELKKGEKQDEKDGNGRVQKTDK